ncbi:nuclear transport factor 2 family protein [Paracoccus sp. (in: a-proteobacteria)]|uniref:nuclear transport factor 2 family protein n=1 Tax=Paracoccus sp. TaxID=267 RepID=UPI003A8A190E
MNRAAFDDYIARFNNRDVSGFEMYIASDMKMLNGALEFTGVEGMKEHYVEKIWPHFDERLNVLGFVASDSNAAVRMRTVFTARADGDTLFGPVKKGQRFVYLGVIFYDIRDSRFTSITVAYNSFRSITPDGTETELGMPH